MTIYEQGDVLLVPFPFTDQSTAKRRPAVVLSSRAYNQAHRDVILAPITSRITGDPDEVVLNDWREARLLKPSAVKPVLSTFDVSLVIKSLGTLSDPDCAQVRTLFAQVLNLPG